MTSADGLLEAVKRRRAVEALVHLHSQTPKRCTRRSTAGSACRRQARCCRSRSSTPHGKIAGMTTYMNVDAANRRVEIGSTWYRQARAAQRAQHPVQAAAADATPSRSSTALRSSSARISSIIRAGAASSASAPSRTAFCATIRLRPTALARHLVYSIIASEWPTVKAHLDYQLERRSRGNEAAPEARRWIRSIT